MPVTFNDEMEQATKVLAKMSKSGRSFLLSRLVSDMFDDEQPSEPIPIHRPDGTLLGYIRPLLPPTGEDELEMNRRAKQVDPARSRPTSTLLEKMRAGDLESVSEFIR